LLLWSGASIYPAKPLHLHRDNTGKEIVKKKERSRTRKGKEEGEASMRVEEKDYRVILEKRIREEGGGRRARREKVKLREGSPKKDFKRRGKGSSCD